MSARPPAPKLVVRKHGGDDPYSYAVFAVGNPRPLVTGCNRLEAQSHKRTLKAMFAERAAGGSPSSAFEPD